MNKLALLSNVFIYKNKTPLFFSFVCIHSENKIFTDQKLITKNKAFYLKCQTIFVPQLASDQQFREGNAWESLFFSSGVSQ